MITILPPEGASPPPPTARFDRRRIGAGLGILMIAVLAGVSGWLLRGGRADVNPLAVPVGRTTQFLPGSVTERVLDVAYWGPAGTESFSPNATPPGRVDSARVFVVALPEGGLVVLLQRSPFLGCRVVEVTRAEVTEFGHEVGADFERGFLDPCHGGLFSLDGRHLAGPGERGLDRFPVRYLADGTVAVDVTALQTMP